MGFSEISFLFVFLPVSIVVYLLFECLFKKDTLNNIILILFSLLFYYWADKEAFLLFIQLIAFTYMAGYLASKGKISFSLVCIVGVLLYYKYTSYVVNIINDLCATALIKFEVLLVPIAISFIVFESISYIIDIYKGNAEPGNLIECAIYLSLYPKLVSGPIVLWKDFSSQLKGRRASLFNIVNGIDRIIIGYAKKVIIADTFGAQASLITSRIIIYNADVGSVWLRSLLWFFQLYFDFSGYSDIAIGICSIFGFTVKENFRYPYLSTSISDFWRRWHISLGTWFREYIYIPLGGNRKGNVYCHLIIVFLLTGIWHGAGFRFLVWGGIQAICVVIERAISNKLWYKKIPKFLKWLLTIMIVFFSWIIFMSSGLSSAFENIKFLFYPMTSNAINYTWQYYLSKRIFVLLLVVIFGELFGIEKINKKVKSLLSTRIGLLLKRMTLILLFVLDILFVVNSSYSPFIYFQF